MKTRITWTTPKFALMISRTYRGVLVDLKFNTVIDSCKNGMVFDALRGSCVEAHCQHGFKKLGKTCVRMEKDKVGGIYGNTSRRIKECLFKRMNVTIAKEYQRNSTTEYLIRKYSPNIYAENSSIYVFTRNSQNLSLVLDDNLNH